MKNEKEIFDLCMLYEDVECIVCSFYAKDKNDAEKQLEGMMLRFTDTKVLTAPYFIKTSEGKNVKNEEIYDSLKDWSVSTKIWFL